MLLRVSRKEFGSSLSKTIRNTRKLLSANDFEDKKKVDAGHATVVTERRDGVREEIDLKDAPFIEIAKRI